MMKKIFALSIIGLLVFAPIFSYASQAEGGDITFDVNPKTVSTSGDRIVDITFRVAIYEPQFKNFCGSGNNSAFNWLVATDQSTLQRPDGSFFAGQQSINGNQTTTQTFDLSGKAKMPLLSGIPTLNVWAKIQCTNLNATTVTKSAVIQVTNAGAEGTIWACLAADGKYACSPGNKKDLSDVPNDACKGKTAIQIDSAQCGSIPGGGNPTATKSYSFSIDNPLNGGPNNIFDIINIATTWLLNISIPLAVLLILYAGFLMLTAGGTPGKFDRGKKILINVVIGLAVIFIGRGFITLIYSILELGNSNSNPPTTQSP